MTDIEKIGERGEAIAVRYLQQLGYRILARNFRYQKGEIDIIATDERFLRGCISVVVDELAFVLGRDRDELRCELDF